MDEVMQALAAEFSLPDPARLTTILVRVLVAALHDEKVLPLGLLERRLHQAIQELHGGQPDEFPETVRSLILLRDFCEGLRKNEPPR